MRQQQHSTCTHTNLSGAAASLLLPFPFSCTLAPTPTTAAAASWCLQGYLTAVTLTTVCAAAADTAAHAAANCSCCCAGAGEGCSSGGVYQVVHQQRGLHQALVAVGEHVLPAADDARDRVIELEPLAALLAVHKHHVVLPTGPNHVLELVDSAGRLQVS